MVCEDQVAAGVFGPILADQVPGFRSRRIIRTWISDPVSKLGCANPTGGEGALPLAFPGVLLTRENGGGLADLKARLTAKALDEGVRRHGRGAGPMPFPELPGRLADFVGAGRHGQMGWMAERMSWRGDPLALWPEVRSVVMLGRAVYAGA